MRLKFISLCLVGLMGVSYAENAKSVDYFVKNDKEREKTIATCQQLAKQIENGIKNRLNIAETQKNNCLNAELALKEVATLDMDKQIETQLSSNDKFEGIHINEKNQYYDKLDYNNLLMTKIGSCYAKMSENLAKNGDDGLKSDKRCSRLIMLAENDPLLPSINDPASPFMIAEFGFKNYEKISLKEKNKDLEHCYSVMANNIKKTINEKKSVYDAYSAINKNERNKCFSAISSVRKITNSGL
ncbi:hypothetical protein [Helicobacter cetorum]|uniref:Uncharacterized protein n=1 Tax=Helicobacter cetorum (strain ATCC BAA-540 / CCUG 52418 / MIT 99-5656) TaxID=1163745 RepID=I0EUN2_HELCM|nr:hypothetical protein [Helicobacter cetorum]AFI06502.1 hypothetical protein HCD_07575 [Helicobacter cetorum MIT 99-5656]AFI06651.1 hypothetical protein HCD_08345 [Helicobacter cetorum MIT 99-5656]